MGNYALSGLKPVIISGTECHPIVEGGKGVSATNGHSAGAFAAAGAVGTISGVNADSYDQDGKLIPYVYKGTTRRERHEELVDLSIRGGIAQAKIGHDISNGNGRIHVNVLWEMGGAERVLRGILEGSKGLINGITCGAGMPYKLGDLAEEYNVHYYPIISSMRAFRALWKRGYKNQQKLLGGVVYEDPWLAGGHNGLSNSEHPEQPQDPYPRVAELRGFMNEVGLHHVPIVMAGGVWFLKDFAHWLDNPEIGLITFQYGTRPLLTQESPIPDLWKQHLLALKPGDVFLNKFSPTGFYSSAVNNSFIKELRGREARQVAYATEEEGYMAIPYPFGPRKRSVYITAEDKDRVDRWVAEGYDEPMKTPEGTLMFVSKNKALEIHQDQVDCMGCLSHCRFSNWKDHDDFSTGKRADPRSFCIQKTLQHIAHGEGDIDHQLMFSGHNAYKFAQDPFYANGNIPTIGELVERILSGE